VKVTLGGEEMIHINIKGDIGPSFSIAWFFPIDKCQQQYQRDLAMAIVLPRKFDIPQLDSAHLRLGDDQCHAAVDCIGILCTPRSATDPPPYSGFFWPSRSGKAPLHVRGPRLNVNSTVKLWPWCC
jgi:hypothetical protein